MDLKAKLAVIAYLAEIGRKGGKKSRRKLTPEQARAMVKAREKKRAKVSRTAKQPEGLPIRQSSSK